MPRSAKVKYFSIRVYNDVHSLYYKESGRLNKPIKIINIINTPLLVFVKTQREATVTCQSVAKSMC